ncbi:MAG: two-component system response regulator [Geobacteraceae bacterium GWC2_55_20]|nr:MAG: two-component system response regulator [Geobacteraceae bacterium GWC2_55_20]OGU26011.1 MAG: two-component system response regulator [Geobacteraceae bacterium GWF2_54_21]
MYVPVETAQNSRIMIVDDEMANLKLLEKMLRAEGYTNLVSISDPRQVRDAYCAEPTDLILLDLNMPFMNGYEVMAQLKELEDPLLPPILVLTAQGSRDFLMRALNEGARDFLSKPFDRYELLARVRNLLEAHLALRLTFDKKGVLEEMVRKRTAEVIQSRLEIVQRLGRASEYRDNETGRHILRMSHSAALLAKQIGWSKERCDLMLYASPMHDLGKIGISDTIMLKPARLTDEERAIMETHTTIGADILSGSNNELLETARVIALTHHEKWDGSGYPRKLSGEAIPMEGRVAAIVDVFDALTSIRPYKKAWPVEEAVEDMRINSGTHFDPNLVDHFMTILPGILKIRELFSEP